MSNSNNLIYDTESHESITGLFAIAKIRFLIFKIITLRAISKFSTTFLDMGMFYSDLYCFWIGSELT